jgi:hypothetical protein
MCAPITKRAILCVLPRLFLYGIFRYGANAKDYGKKNKLPTYLKVFYKSKSRNAVCFLVAGAERYEIVMPPVFFARRIGGEHER